MVSSHSLHSNPSHSLHSTSSSRKSASVLPPHSGFYANLPLRRLDLPLPPPRQSATVSAASICHYLDLPLPLPLPPRSASIAAFTRRPPHESTIAAALIYLCHRLHTNRPLSPPPLTGLPTPAWSFHSQFLTVTFLDNPLSFLYFGFCLILNQCYFLWICDCDFELLFSYWKIDNPMWC